VLPDFAPRVLRLFCPCCLRVVGFAPTPELTLQTWIKFYEAITKPLPVASALFLIVSTSFLLAAPDSTLAKLGMSHVVADYRWVVGLGFVVASTWLAVTALIWLSKWLYRGPRTKLARLWAIRRAKHQVAKDIPQMTPREREIIGYLLAKNQRMFTNTADGGYANTLISKKIVVCALLPGQVFTQFEVPFEVPQHVWNVLVKHKAEFPYTPPKAGGAEPHPWRVHWNVR
jgi:hypothetical protein